LHKRRGDDLHALPLWEQAAGEGQIEAFIELAKYYEHRAQDLAAANYWAQAALQIVNAPGFPAQQRKYWQEELDHRLERLSKKLGISR
jgi:TPR repeat protein